MTDQRTSGTNCTCPRVDGFRIRKAGCPAHGADDAEVAAAQPVTIVACPDMEVRAEGFNAGGEQ